MRRPLPSLGHQTAPFIHSIKCEMRTMRSYFHHAPDMLMIWNWGTETTFYLVYRSITVRHFLIHVVDVYKILVNFCRFRRTSAFIFSTVIIIIIMKKFPNSYGIGPKKVRVNSTPYGLWTGTKNLGNCLAAIFLICIMLLYGETNIWERVYLS